MKYFYTILIQTCILILLFKTNAMSADSNTHFAVKGAGGASVERFTHAYKNKTNELLIYGGWIEGYITAMNQMSKDTFDFAPWQSTDLLITAIARFSEKRPNENFFNLVRSMLESLKHNRLKEQSSVETIRIKNQVLLMYTEILKQVQQKLSELNMYNGEITGVFNEKTKSALTNFQKSKMIAVTGFPDQKTLILLMERK